MLAAAVSAVAQPPSQCQTADSNSVNLIDYVTYILASNDPGVANLRTRLGLAGLDATDVSLSTSSKTCNDAAAAIDALASTPNSGRMVLVVKVGTNRYVVADPGNSEGYNTSVFVFDSHFTLIGPLLR